MKIAAVVCVAGFFGIMVLPSFQTRNPMTDTSVADRARQWGFQKDESDAIAYIEKPQHQTSGSDGISAGSTFSIERSKGIEPGIAGFTQAPTDGDADAGPVLDVRLFGDTAITWEGTQNGNGVLNGNDMEAVAIDEPTVPQLSKLPYISRLHDAPDKVGAPASDKLPLSPSPLSSSGEIAEAAPRPEELPGNQAALSDSLKRRQDHSDAEQFAPEARNLNGTTLETEILSEKSRLQQRIELNEALREKKANAHPGVLNEVEIEAEAQNRDGHVSDLSSDVVPGEVTSENRPSSVLFLGDGRRESATTPPLTLMVTPQILIEDEGRNIPGDSAGAAADDSSSKDEKSQEAPFFSQPAFGSRQLTFPGVKDGVDSGGNGIKQSQDDGVPARLSERPAVQLKQDVPVENFDYSLNGNLSNEAPLSKGEKEILGFDLGLGRRSGEQAGTNIDGRFQDIRPRAMTIPIISIPVC